jgi:Na+/H+ antiporter NhaD/arsenite permease-like protein
MENVFGEGFLTCGIIIFYFSMMILWSKSLREKISKITRENKNDEENAGKLFLQLQVILFLILGGFLFMNHRNE